VMLGRYTRTGFAQGWMLRPFAGAAVLNVGVFDSALRRVASATIPPTNP
jgi:hypothetical protein